MVSDQTKLQIVAKEKTQMPKKFYVFGPPAIRCSLCRTIMAEAVVFNVFMLAFYIRLAFHFRCTLFY